MEELDERLTRVYAARTLPELRSITQDLVAVPHGGDGATLVLHGEGFGATVRRDGRWLVPPHIVLACGNSDVRLDFTAADVAVDGIHVDVDTKWGNVLLVVPQGWSIDLDGVTTKGGTIRNKAVDPSPGSVRLRVTGRTKHGNVTVRHRRRRHWPFRS